MFARSLATVRPGKRIMLFDHLIGRYLDSRRLHALFAALRSALVDIARSEHAAMYTPPGDAGKREGQFPLHADLYVPRYLFNVFDNTPSGPSGASLFLPVGELRRILKGVPSLPHSTRSEILSLFNSQATRDNYSAQYDLLHGRHRWVPELESKMRSQQMRILLRSGQGYLLHDRIWLHGREAPKGGVPIDRFRRLIFNPVRSRC
jgi:hypothetical protein